MRAGHLVFAVVEKLRRSYSIFITLLTVAVVISVFQTINPAFLSYGGVRALVYAMSYFLIAACGLTFVILMGSFDFSVVSLLKLAALFCVLYIDRYGMAVIPLALLITTGFGLVNGLLVGKLNVPSFMATLGVSIVAEGIALYLSKGHLYLMYNEQFRALAITEYGGFPVIFYWAIFIWLVSIFLALFTPFGRRTYAVGANLVAAGLSGVNIARHRMAVFMLSGLYAGIAGVLYMGQLGGGSMLIGADLPVPLFASVVAGGTALTGGVGGPHRTILGVILITWTQAGMLMLAVGRDIQMLVFGLIAIILAAATIDRRRVRLVK